MDEREAKYIFLLGRKCKTWEFLEYLMSDPFKRKEILDKALGKEINDFGYEKFCPKLFTIPIKI